MGWWTITCRPSRARRMSCLIIETPQDAQMPMAAARFRPIVAGVLLIAVAACHGSQSPGPTSPPPPPPPVATATLVGAADIAMCGSHGTEATAAILDQVDGTVFTAGDNAYFQGTMPQYLQCYDPTWGRHKGRT